MLKSILKTNNNHKLEDHFLKRPCINVKSQKETTSSKESVRRENGFPLLLNYLSGNGEPQAPLTTPRTKKKVRFNPSLQQDGNPQNGKPKKPPQSSARKKARVKRQDTTDGDGVTNAKECNVVIQNGFHAKWGYSSTRWAARLEHLSEMKEGSLKCIRSKSPTGDSVYYCENQSLMTVGSGPDYSSVFLGIMNNNKKVAIKKVNVKRVPLLLDEERQQSILLLAPNPRIAKVYFITRDKTHFYIVRELCENSLKHELKMRQYIPEIVRPKLDSMALCYDIAKCISELHKHGLTHMSIKPENIFIDGSGEVKVADYNIHNRSATKKQQYMDAAGSLCWLPSEALGTKNPKYTLESDIASLGMIFGYLMADRTHPFGDPENSPAACIKNIHNGHYNLKAIKDSFGRDLVRHMILKEPEKRITIEQVLEHPYFWSDSKKCEYVKLLGNAVFLTSGNFGNSNTMCNNLMGLLERSGPGILQACTNAKELWSFPKGVTSNLKSMMQHVHNCIQIAKNGECQIEFTNKILMLYPGVLLETYAQFSAEDLTILISDLGPLHATYKQERHFMLQQSLSADSGVGSPEAYGINFQGDFELCDINGFPFENHDRGRYREDSECYASTDDGIDVLSPLGGSLTGEFVFSSPVKIEENSFKDKWRTHDSSLLVSPEGYSSSVDNHFEFDGFGYMGEKETLKPCIAPPDIPATDMDELD